MPRGRPFEPGRSPNPAGRPRGIKAKKPLHLRIMEETLADGGGTVMSKVRDMAEGGDMVAARLFLDRTMPPLKERAIHFDMPEINTPADLVLATRAIIYGVASGELTPSEGNHLQTLAMGHIKAIQASDHAARLEAIEAQLTNGSTSVGEDGSET